MISKNEKLKVTPLYDIHKGLNARMVSFAVWEMPVQYTLLCYPSGGVVDDVTLYKFSDTRYMFCVNASNTEKDFKWIKENIKSLADVKDMSSWFGQIAIQGPLSQEVLQNTCNLDLSLIRYYHFKQGNVTGVDAIVSRTGYTGEDGFEIYTQWDNTVKVWEGLTEAGKRFGIKPIGLGARDTLRLEMGFPLYGNELNENITPLEAGLHKFVKLDTPSFFGQNILEKQAKEGLNKRLVGLEMIESGIPRSHYKIFARDRAVGEITSGTMSPSLSKAIGMGYVETQFSSIDTKLSVEIRNKMVMARVIKTPFYKRNMTTKVAN